jgi:hypothetical protein
LERKEGRLDEVRREMGNEFQTVGAAKVKERRPEADLILPGIERR